MIDDDLPTIHVELVQYSRDKAVYFSSRFYTTIAGAGTADRDLMRLTISRCETDLGNIKIAYQSLYGMSLSTAVTVCCLAQILWVY
jgi:annexin A7/11